MTAPNQTSLRTPVRVLFLCTHNSSRSQIAEGLLREMGGDGFASFSAGTEVTRVNPFAIVAMDEIGVDIRAQYSKHMRDLLGETFDAVITVCDSANESCPIFPAKTERIHWSLPDPSAATGTDAEKLAAFRSVRDRLRDELLPAFIAAQRQRREVTVGATA